MCTILLCSRLYFDGKHKFKCVATDRGSINCFVKRDCLTKFFKLERTFCRNAQGTKACLTLVKYEMQLETQLLGPTSGG